MTQVKDLHWSLRWPIVVVGLIILFVWDVLRGCVTFATAEAESRTEAVMEWVALGVCLAVAIGAGVATLS